MKVGGATFGSFGALAAFPRRLAAREVARQGGVFRRGITRRTGYVVFGRRLLDTLDEAGIGNRYDETLAARAVPLSENGFRRALGLLGRPEGANLPRAQLLAQSGLDGRTFDLLCLFDAFEHDAELFALADVILARKYARLVESGAGWAAIARSVHRTGKVTSLTAKSLHASEDEIYVREGETLAEIDGQGLLPLDADTDPDPLFEAAEAAEQAGRYAEAAALYSRYLSADPLDSVAAFNRANALKAAGAPAEAAASYALAIKRDPSFVEAWFNFGILHAAEKRPDLARAHFEKAIALDPTYADPVYNLAALELDQGRLEAARRWWSRYIELDPSSEWGRRAARGVQYIDLRLEADRRARMGRSA